MLITIILKHDKNINAHFFTKRLDVVYMNINMNLPQE